jgi:predicted DNA-binding transcriptional regulator AlpA
MSASNENKVVLASDGIGELVDVPSLAKRLNVSRSTLQAWRYTGRGPRWIKLGRLIRYRVRNIDDYLEAHTRGNVA